ncbi:MAG: hypothetical protein RLY97_1535 [Pseudomonadota bacterium]
MSQNQNYDAIIIGAGAAGLFCAAQAGQRGRRILLLDHVGEAGRKILISGGGRCNFTNIHTDPTRFLSQNLHFAKSALSRYTPQDFLALIEQHHIAWHEKTLGQLFCDGSARQIVTMLLDECAKGAVEQDFHPEIRDISHRDGQFHLTLNTRTATAPQLVIASGGPAIPKLGATGFAYELARQFGLKVVQPRPALVPLTLSNDDILFRELSGVSADVVATSGKAAFREAALFTHRGLSGPAILQASSYWQHGQPVRINFLPDSAPDWLIHVKHTRPKAHLRKILAETLSERLALRLSDLLGISTELGQTPDRALIAAQSRLADWHFTPNGSEGYAKAEVAAGGISTAELSSKTMESRRVPGLFAIGEAVDVTGWLGGYNFQWAWASAYAAAQAL